MPKIIFLFTPGPLGGAEKIVLGGVKSLLSEGHQIEIWVIKEERVPKHADIFISLLDDNGIASKIFPCLGVLDISLLKNLKKSFKESDASLVHAHGFKGAFYGKLACPKGLPFIVTHHGKTGHTLKVRIYEFLEDLIMKRSQGVIAVSNEMKRVLTESGISSSKLHLVENFLTIELTALKSDSQKPLHLVFIGRLSPEKGCDVLIRAMKDLSPKDMHLTVIGDGSEREKLEGIVKNENLSGSVNFLGFQKNISELLANSHALVLPSFREGQPLTLIEATCMGLPVVASRVGGIPEIVNDGESAYLVKAGDVKELSEALKMLSMNYFEMKNQAEAARPNYVNRFSVKTWVEKTLEVYQKVLSQS